MINISTISTHIEFTAQENDELKQKFLLLELLVVLIDEITFSDTEISTNYEKILSSYKELFGKTKIEFSKINSNLSLENEEVKKECAKLLKEKIKLQKEDLITKHNNIIQEKVILEKDLLELNNLKNEISSFEELKKKLNDDNITKLKNELEYLKIDLEAKKIVYSKLESEKNNLQDELNKITSFLYEVEENKSNLPNLIIIMENLTTFLSKDFDVKNEILETQSRNLSSVTEYYNNITNELQTANQLLKDITDVEKTNRDLYLLHFKENDFASKNMMKFYKNIDYNDIFDPLKKISAEIEKKINEMDKIINSFLTKITLINKNIRILSGIEKK